MIDCERRGARDNIHTLHQAWQIPRADGARDKHREEKLADEEKKNKGGVSMCLNWTHMCGAAGARAPEENFDPPAGRSDNSLCVGGLLVSVTRLGDLFRGDGRPTSPPSPLVKRRERGGNRERRR